MIFSTHSTSISSLSSTLEEDNCVDSEDESEEEVRESSDELVDSSSFDDEEELPVVDDDDVDVDDTKVEDFITVFSTHSNSSLSSEVEYAIPIEFGLRLLSCWFL